MKKNLLVLLATSLILSACQTVSTNSDKEDVSNILNATSTPIVELADGAIYNMEASFVEQEIDGSMYKMLAYNGSIPGPTLKVQQGSTITINLTNNTNVETTLHPHGVRMDNAFDGVPEITQEVTSVGETFSYQLRFDDAGVYWYHPHFRQDYAQDMGLYGNYIVAPIDPSDWASVNREEVLAVDDILIENGSLAPYLNNEITHTLMGRFGNTILVNGNTDYELQVDKGEIVRFYITNTANTRVFNLEIPEAKMKLVGSDNGLLEKDEWKDEIMLSTSERAIVEVLFEQSGTYDLIHQTPDKTYELGKINVSDQEVTENFAADFDALKTHTSTVTSIDPYRGSFSKELDKLLSIDLEMKGMGGSHSMNGGMMMADSAMSVSEVEPIEWEDGMSMMNSTSNTDTLTWKLVDEETKKVNMDIDDWNFKQGDIIKIRITNPNDTLHPMQHPIHLHGQRFLMLSADGVETENLAWKDTILVPAGSTVDILVVMDNPGNWVLHCHISEHPEAGMMMPFNVTAL